MDSGNVVSCAEEWRSNTLTFRTTDTAARNRAHTESKHEVRGFLQKSTYDKSGLVQDYESVTRHRFDKRGTEARTTLDATRGRGRIRRALIGTQARWDCRRSDAFLFGFPPPVCGGQK